MRSPIEVNISAHFASGTSWQVPTGGAATAPTAPPRATWDSRVSGSGAH